MSHILTSFLVDTHCHLNFKAFADDAGEVIKHTQEAGVGMVVVGADVATSKKAIELAGEHDGVWAAVGIHPIHVNKLKSKQERDMAVEGVRQLVFKAKVVAIGEIGLDYYREPIDKEGQKEVLRGLLKLAKESEKPIIFHSRQSFDNSLVILKECARGLSGVFHCFGGNWEQAREILDLGFYLGFNGLITYSGDEANREVVRRMPIERLVLETDSPFLTPVPLRGQRNEPANVKLVAQEIAKLRDIDESLVAKVITENAKRIFKI